MYPEERAPRRRGWASQQEPGRVPALHRRASEWYEHNGLPADAIRYTLAAGDFERTASLIELAWAKALPDAMVCARPVLSAGYAWKLLIGGEIDAGKTLLRDAERLRDATAGASDAMAGFPKSDCAPHGHYYHDRCTHPSDTRARGR